MRHHPRSGWLCRIAGVSIDPDSLSHIYPCGSVDLEATLSCCHSNAYLGCSWYGGAGITFSHEHSLSTEATYAPDDPEDWTTNVISLVSRFVGYTLTNHLHFTVGITNEPPLRFSIGCQDVFFLNDADFLEGACPSNRPERIRPVTLNLTGPVGTNWGLESGHGFYEKSDTRRVVMSRMLMHGVSMGEKADIPNGVVFSLRRNAYSPQQTFYPHVGADHIAPNNSEVLSK